MLKVPFTQTRPKKSRTDKKTPYKRTQQTQQIARLQLKVVDLQSKLDQSHKLNDLYLSQIRQLEDDNLILCHRLQQLKIQKEGIVRQFTGENDKLKEQIKELLKVVGMLERDVEESHYQIDGLRPKLEEYRQEAEEGKTAQLRMNQLSAQLQRSKIKLLESQKYWITRCETLLAQQRASNEQLLRQKEQQLTFKIKMLTDDLRLKEQEVGEKTKQIYKLIQHIQTLNI